MSKKITFAFSRTLAAAAVVTALAAGSAFAAPFVTITQDGPQYTDSTEGLTVKTNEDGSLVITAAGFPRTEGEAYGYGAVTNNNGGSIAKVVIGKGSRFTNNEASGSAGALVIFQNGKDGTGSTDNTITGTVFTSNTSNSKGGAVATLQESQWEGDETYGTTTVTGSTFESNSAKSGGALYGERTGYTVNDSRFDRNKASENGGAVYVEYTDMAVNNSTFSTNNAGVSGGAIYAKDAKNLTISKSTFTDNEADDNGGAIMAMSDSDGGTRKQIFTVSESSFDKNIAADKGGALAWLQVEENEKGNQFLDVSLSTFTSNEAREYGGAIAAESDARIADSDFIGNKARLNENGRYGNGGAIYAKRSLSVDESYFENNTAEGSGGAIYTDNYGINLQGLASAQDLSRSITRSTFKGNKASKGGAIAILTETDFEPVKTVIDQNTFENNTATQSGGAIQAEDDVSITNSDFTGNSAVTGGAVNADFDAVVTAENVTFTGNTAKTAGGAMNIGAKSTVNLKNAAFSNNKVGEQFNDINNDGTINASGEITLDGGISGAGTLNLADGTLLNVVAGKTTISNNVVNGGATLNLKFDRGFTGNYELITDEGSLDKAFTMAQNGIYTITEATDADGNVIHGQYVVEKRSASDIAATVGADSNQAAGLEAITQASQGATNQTFDSIADYVNTNIQSANAADRQAALDAVSALTVETAPMIVQTQTDAATQIYSAVGSRLGFASDQQTDSNLWVQGLFSTGDYDDNGSAHGYDTDSNGVAFGLDSAVTDSFRIGVGFAYTDTDVDGFLRDTDVETKTAFLYGQYKPSNWYVNGIVSYGWSSYEESKHVAGLNVGADYDVDTFGLQAMTGYDFDVAGMRITPEGGLRYFHLSQDDYSDAAGTQVEGEDNDVLTAVVGAKFSKAWEVSPAFVIKPQARVAMTYDLMDADNNAVLTLANGATYRVEGETMDRFGVEVDVGVSAEVSENFEFALSYSGNFRGDFQNHAGLINAKYKF